MAGHTEGPWSLPHFVQPNVNCNCGYVLVESNMGAVATVHASCVNTDYEHGDNPLIEEAIANANLIAAAPDMLEALKVAYECLTRAQTGEEFDFKTNVVFAAIAKAEGRS